MEFERSLFRVYEKILSPLNSGNTSATRWRRYLKAIMMLCLATAVSSLASVVLLHLSFEGDGSCLASSLSAMGLEPRILDATRNFSLFDMGEDSHQMIFSDSVIRVWAFPEESALRSSPTDMDEISSSTPLDEDTTILLPSQARFDVLESRTTKPDYEFSADPAFLLIDESLRVSHRVQEWNVTFDRSCLGIWNRFSLTRSIVESSMDEIIVNQFLHGLKDSEGVLRSQHTHETWSWSHVRLDKRRSLISRLLVNVGALWRALVLFLLVSSMTALMVRTLVSSGVAIMFPVFALFRSLGFIRGDVFRLLTLSYPWIGGDVEVLEATGQSMGPFVRAHILNVFLTYASYEACQFAWRRWLIGFKPQPAGIEIFVFAYVMICEYFMLIFARAPMTLRYLPRLLAMNFVLFLLYAFSVPYGFVSTLGVTLWSGSLFWMLYFIMECELKALRRGTVSVEAPRAFYTLLASPQWPMALPPHWSTYHELNRVHRSIYDLEVPSRDVEEGGGQGTSNTTTQRDAATSRARGQSGSSSPSHDSATSGSASASAVSLDRGAALAHRRTRRGTDSAPLVLNPPASLSGAGVEDQV